MSIKLTEKIQRILFEDNWVKYGSEYMSHPYVQEEVPTTLPDELPIEASATANMQLTDTAPAIDDPSYVPTNNKELAGAFAALALKVPDDQVANLYRQVKIAVNQAELAGDPQVQAAEAEEADEAELEVAREEDGMLEARTRQLLKQIVEAGLSDWSGIKFGRQYKLEDTPEVDPSEIPPTELKGKYIAQYYRDRPGKPPESHKGTGESTMVTASGRLMQNVVAPLFKVPSAQLEDAIEYLRLQFQVLTETETDVPKESAKAFSGMYMKKIVPKMNDADLKNFLTNVVTDFKGRPKKWLHQLAQKAIAETNSEMQAFANLKQTLADEDPVQAEVLSDLFPGM